MSDRDEYIAEALHHDGMPSWPGSRQPDGEWSNEDLDRVWRDVKKHGLTWAYKASGFATK